MTHLIDDINFPPALIDQIDIQPSLVFGRTKIKDEPSYVLQDEIPQYCNIHHIPLIPAYVGETTSGNFFGWKCTQCDC